jgi:hypothetical protein
MPNSDICVPSCETCATKDWFRAVIERHSRTDVFWDDDGNAISLVGDSGFDDVTHHGRWTCRSCRGEASETLDLLIAGKFSDAEAGGD